MPFRPSARGLTLVEVMIVAGLVALLGAAVLSGAGFVGNTRVRAGATLTLGAIRLAITRANTLGRPVRIVFDIDQDRLILEDTTGRLLRNQSEGDPAVGAEPATVAEQEAAEYAKAILDGPRAPRARFTAVREFATDGEKTPGRSLGSGVDLRLVQTEHDAEPRTSGRAYLYFWPAGGTERAVIQLSRTGDPLGLSIVVSSLTGRARIERGAVEFATGRDEEKFGVREEER